MTKPTLTALRDVSNTAIVADFRTNKGSDASQVRTRQTSAGRGERPIRIEPWVEIVRAHDN